MSKPETPYDHGLSTGARFAPMRWVIRGIFVLCLVLMIAVMLSSAGDSDHREVNLQTLPDQGPEQAQTQASTTTKAGLPATAND